MLVCGQVVGETRRVGIKTNLRIGAALFRVCGIVVNMKLTIEERRSGGLPYEQFCARKLDYTYQAGHPCDLSEINPILFDHQKAIVQWAVEGGRRAIFASFGTGKSNMQIETVRLTMAKGDCKRGLIVCPLGVRQEFKRDAAMLGVEIRFVRRTDEAQEPGMYLTNYESIRDGKLDVSLFDVISLDEAACLRSYGSKTFVEFLRLCHDTKYKFVATATPSPNKYKELIHYGGFLGIMSTGSALTRWFQRDSTQANNLTLYPHKEREFWLWLASWSVFLQKPSDLGFSDDGYVMPPIEVVWHELPVDHSANIAVDKYTGQSILFRDEALGLSGAAAAKRDSMSDRIERMTEIVNASPDDHFILWHDLEDERRAIKKAFPEASEVYGALDLDTREERVLAFSDGETRLLATKPVLSGSGCNFQRHCHRAVFLGVGFKFSDFIQSLHRIQRFGQTRPVRIDIIYTENERSVREILETKWKKHEELTNNMSQIIIDHGLAHIRPEDIGGLVTDIRRVAVSGKEWTLVNNDTVRECAQIAENSVDLIVSSIPFGNQYGYVNNVADFGHNDNNTDFWVQMQYLWPNLLRILKPGRIFACHVKDRVQFGNVTGEGVPTIAPFHCEATMEGIKHGFQFLGMITVTTDVVRENNQTYRLGWTEHSKDATKMGIGCPEYVLLFRAPQTDLTRGYADTPVTHPKDEYSIARWQIDAHAWWPSSGDRMLTSEEMMALPVNERMKKYRDHTLRNVYDYEATIQLAEEMEAQNGLSREFSMLAPASSHPHVWSDINRMLTLNSEQKRRNLEMHVCPLAIPLVDRLIEQYSMPGELVFDPFAGIGTVPTRALKKGRKGAGVELNADYFRDAMKYCELAEQTLNVPSLFDLLEP